MSSRLVIDHIEFRVEKSDSCRGCHFNEPHASCEPLKRAGILPSCSDPDKIIYIYIGRVSGVDK
jgi:hypothetical protein